MSWTSRLAKKSSALALGVGAFALIAGAANAAPLVKECGKDGKFVIGFSQANNAEPYRQHVNDELTAAAAKVAAVHAADRRRRRQREHADLADGQFHHPEGRPDPHLAVRSRRR